MGQKTLVASAILLGAILSPSAALAANDAAEMYKLRCSACHGSNGQGTRATLPSLGPALKGNPFVMNGSPAAIKSVIRKGRQGQKRLYDDTYPNMPAFGFEAVPDPDALIAYMKDGLQK
ncbi:MAG TPA: cytochrome c [Usitatibacter sp.]|nr:cytochrome c [Usitatibacter sp.]